MSLKKRITAIGLAAVITAGTLCVGASAYTPIKSWSIDYTRGAPSNVGNSYQTVTIPKFGDGYRTNCIKISGSNDRKVIVTTNIYTREITTTGLSAVIPHNEKDAEGNNISFGFGGYGAATCVANGTVGYNL